MEKNNHLPSIVHDFQYNEALETRRKELLGNLRSDAYAGYTQVYGRNTKKLLEKLKADGIKVQKMWLLLDLLSKKKAGIKRAWVGWGGLIGIGRDSEDVESTLTHEATHVKQYRENSPTNFLKARLWAVKFWLLDQWMTVRKKLKKEREKYGTKAARRYSINNSPMEYEAYLHEGDVWYLETRKPFAYKQFETPKGRSAAVQQLMDEDIKERVKKIHELADMIKTKEEISKEEVAMINTLTEEVLQDAKKIRQIKEEYGNGDRELLSTFKTPKWPMVRLESEKNRDKRLQILDKFLPKEHELTQELKKNTTIKFLSSQAEMDETWIIKITSKIGNDDDLLSELERDPMIHSLAPEMKIIYYKPDKIGNPTATYIRISFIA